MCEKAANDKREAEQTAAAQRERDAHECEQHRRLAELHKVWKRFFTDCLEFSVQHIFQRLFNLQRSASDERSRCTQAQQTIKELENALSALQAQNQEALTEASERLAQAESSFAALSQAHSVLEQHMADTQSALARAEQRAGLLDEYEQRQGSNVNDIELSPNASPAELHAKLVATTVALRSVRSEKEVLQMTLTHIQREIAQVFTFLCIYF
jgi:chromosome segregation ATPase